MQARCLARRAADAFAASPLVLLLAGGAFAALPVLALWAGRSAAPALQSADHRAVVVSAALVAGLAGAAVTLLVPGPRALGCQLEAAPVPWPVAFAGLVLFPVSVALVLVLPAAALFVAPSAGARTPLVLARVLGFAALGGCAAEAAVAVARRSARGLPVAAGCGLLAVLDAPPPLAVVLWAAAAAARPAEPAARGDVTVVVHGVAGTALARYARRRDLRRQAAAGVAVAVAGALALRVVGVLDVAAAFGAFGAVLGAAIVPLAAPGADRAAEWLWRAAPASRRSLAFVFGGVALALGAAVALAGALGALAAAPAPPARLLPLAAVLALVLATGLLAGAVVPWRSDRLGEQLGAYAAFGVVAAVVWASLARLAPLLHAEHGLRAVALVACASLACVAASAGVQGRRT